MKNVRAVIQEVSVFGHAQFHISFLFRPSDLLSHFLFLVSGILISPPRRGGVTYLYRYSCLCAYCRFLHSLVNSPSQYYVFSDSNVSSYIKTHRSYCNVGSDKEGMEKEIWRRVGIRGLGDFRQCRCLRVRLGRFLLRSRY